MARSTSIGSSNRVGFVGKAGKVKGSIGSSDSSTGSALTTTMDKSPVQYPTTTTTTTTTSTTT